jgi:hypothetical protein
MRKNMIPVKEFFTGGKAIFTIEVPETFQRDFKCNPHYTYRIRNKNDNFLIELLTGPNNTKSYTSIGLFDINSGCVKLTGRVSEDSWGVRLFRRVMARIFENAPEAITSSGFDVHHEGRCGKCGKRLSVPESIRLGLGRKCRLGA